MFLTLRALAKPTRILVECKSLSGSGIKRLYKRDRLGPKAVILRYDPVVDQEVLFVETRKVKSLAGSKNRK